MQNHKSDYVVVGAGSAGSAITRRLIDAGHSVHVIEAGQVDTNPNIHSPQGWPGLLMSEDDYAVTTAPQLHAADRSLYWLRGKVLGGSSSLNGMIYMRGDKSDYAAWEAAGATGWGWKNVFPLFKKSEDHQDGATEYHGAGGPLHVERIPLSARHPAGQAFVEAAKATGIQQTDDFNEDKLDGVGFNHTTTKNGKRASAWQSFVVPILDSDRLTVTTGALVHRILIEGGRAVGVEFAGRSAWRRACRRKRMRAAEETEFRSHRRSAPCRLSQTADQRAVRETLHETVRSKQKEIAPEASQDRFLV